MENGMKIRKGQATIEYIVLLAVALIVALVIFGFMGWIPGLAGSLRERQSRVYWGTEWPLAIRDYKITTTGTTFLIQNYMDQKIEITDINYTGGAGTPSPSGVWLVNGETKLYTVSEINCSTGTVGEGFELDNFTITFDVSGGVQGRKEQGVMSLVGRCHS